MWRCGKEAAGDSGQGRMCRESLDTAYTIPMDDDCGLSRWNPRDWVSDFESLL